MKPIISYDMTNEEYHKHPGLSSTFLRSLVTSTPAKALYQKLNPGPETPAMALGTLIHTLVLEPEMFDKRYVVMPEGITKTHKEGKRIAQEAHETSKRIITWNEYSNLGYLINAIETAPDYEIVRNMRERGKPEASIIWNDYVHGKPWVIKSRPDWLWEKEGVIFDLKTTGNAGPTGFGAWPKKAQEMAYPMQAYMAMRGYEAVTGRKPKGHVWVVIESSAPYDITRYDMMPDDQVYWAGEQLFYKALSIYKECKKNNHWPGYGTAPQTLPLSNYYLNQIGDMTYDQ